MNGIEVKKHIARNKAGRVSVVRHNENDFTVTTILYDEDKNENLSAQRVTLSALKSELKTTQEKVAELTEVIADFEKLPIPKVEEKEEEKEA